MYLSRLCQLGTRNSDITVAGPLVVFAVTLLAACTGVDSTAAWVTTTDTTLSGALHVVNTPPPGRIEPTWRIEEELRIGSIEAAGPTSFGEVRGIAVTEDGRIAVLDTQAQELRLFSSTGEHLVTYGGKGGGPGELEGAYGLMLGPEGLLWVPDHRNARMSVYDADRGFDHSDPMRLLSYGYIWRGIISADGRVLKPSITLDANRSRLLRVFDGEMTLIDSLPLPQLPESDPEDPPGSFFFKAPGGDARGYAGVPFYPSRQELLDPLGVIWSTEAGDPSYRIARWVPGGDTTLVLETRRSTVPVTGAERDSAIDAVRWTGLRSRTRSRPSPPCLPLTTANCGCVQHRPTR
jgi:hypothetical protein